MILVCLPYAVRPDCDKLYSLDIVLEAVSRLQAPDGHDVAYLVSRDAPGATEARSRRSWHEAEGRDLYEAEWDSIPHAWERHRWLHTLLHRQRCVEAARELDADFLFFVDSDNPPPSDALVRLVRWGTPIASGWYYRRGVDHPKVPVVFRMAPPTHGVPVMKVIQERGGVWADWCGMGCYLIHRDVFSTVDFEWNRWARRFSEDCQYPLAAREAGFPQVLVDGSLWVPHLNDDGTEV